MAKLILTFGLPTLAVTALYLFSVWAVNQLDDIELPSLEDDNNV